jgi:hypothetical protein
MLKTCASLLKTPTIIRRILYYRDSATLLCFDFARGGVSPFFVMCFALKADILKEYGPIALSQSLVT